MVLLLWVYVIFISFLLDFLVNLAQIKSGKGPQNQIHSEFMLEISLNKPNRVHES